MTRRTVAMDAMSMQCTRRLFRWTGHCGVPMSRMSVVSTRRVAVSARGCAPAHRQYVMACPATATRRGLRKTLTGGATQRTAAVSSWGREGTLYFSNFRLPPAFLVSH